SALDLRILNDILEEKVSVFAQELEHIAGTYNNFINDARNEAQGYSNLNSIDLYDFVINIMSSISIMENISKELIDAINKTVLYEKHGVNVPGSHGIAITFPKHGALPWNYCELSFAKETRFDDFHSYYIKKKNLSNLIPNIEIHEPENNINVSSFFTIFGSALDLDGKIEKVEIKFDRGDWFDAIGKNNWSYEFDSQILSEGKHKIYARAIDNDGEHSFYAFRVINVLKEGLKISLFGDRISKTNTTINYSLNITWDGKGAMNFSVNIYVPENWSFLLSQKNIYLLPKETVNLNLSIKVPGAKENEYMIKINVSSIEKPEIWNCRYIKLKVYEPKPDFFPINISFEPTTLIENLKTKVICEIGNDGDKIGTTTIEIYDYDKLILIDNILNLEPGKSCNITFDWFPSYGLHKIKVFIDPRNEILEWNENNNFMEANVFAYLYGIEVYAKQSLLRILPTENATFLININNIGNYSEEINISVEYNGTWDYLFLPTNSKSMKIFLKAMEKFSLSFVVFPKKNVLGGSNETFGIVASSLKNKTTIFLFVEIEKTYNISLETNEYEKDIGLDETINYTIELKNFGSAYNHIFVKAYGPYSGWKFWLEKNEFFLEAYSSEKFSLSIKSPSIEFGGAWVSTVLTAFSDFDKNSSSSLRLYTNVKKIHKLVISGDDNASMEPDEVRNFMINLKNEGNVLDIFEISSKIPENWYSTISNPFITIDPWKSKEIIFTIVPEKDALAQEYKISILASSADTSAMHNITIKINKITKCEIYTVFSKEKNEPGKETYAVLELRNIGNSNETFYLNITEMPTNWSGEIEPNILSISQNKVGRIKLSIKIPKNAKDGRYEVIVEARSGIYATSNNIFFSVEKSKEEITLNPLLFIIILLSLFLAYLSIKRIRKRVMPKKNK
ncbi:MAG: CARDB domain-containing protein, partial [Candidatus Thermoplasmatota archaeon]